MAAQVQARWAERSHLRSATGLNSTPACLPTRLTAQRANSLARRLRISLDGASLAPPGLKSQPMQPPANAGKSPPSQLAGPRLHFVNCMQQEWRAPCSLRGASCRAQPPLQREVSGWWCGRFGP